MAEAVTRARLVEDRAGRGRRRSNCSAALSGWLSTVGLRQSLVRCAGQADLHAARLAVRVVWPILYALMGIALAMILAEPPSPRRKTALILFFVQLALNFAWSPIFFAGA